MEEYFLEPERLRALRRKFLDLILKLSCYYGLSLSADWGESWKKDPSPEEHERLFAQEDPLPPVYFLIEPEDALLTLRPDDLYMTVYGPGPGLLEIISALAGAEGLFTRKG